MRGLEDKRNWNHGDRFLPTGRALTVVSSKFLDYDRV
jgi:hypothetical protein